MLDGRACVLFWDFVGVLDPASNSLAVRLTGLEGATLGCIVEFAVSPNFNFAIMVLCMLSLSICIITSSSTRSLRCINVMKAG